MNPLLVPLYRSRSFSSRSTIRTEEKLRAFTAISQVRKQAATTPQSMKVKVLSNSRTSLPRSLFCSRRLTKTRSRLSKLLHKNASIATRI
jgi:hypothetical protein